MIVCRERDLLASNRRGRLPHRAPGTFQPSRWVVLLDVR